MRGTPGPVRRLAVLAAAVLITAACGESAASESTWPGGSLATPSAGSGGSRVVTGVRHYQSYTRGEGGRADPGKSPIAIGWVNVEGNNVGNPEATVGAKAAVTYVNNRLGGIDGHPLVLRPCVISPVEPDGQRCGRQLMDDKSVAGIAFGNVFAGDASFNAVVGGRKPVLVGVATGPSVSAAANTFALMGDLPHVFGPWGTYARDVLKTRTALIIQSKRTVDDLSATAIRKGLQNAGLSVETVGFDMDAKDITGAVAAGVQNAGMIVPVSEGKGCVTIAKALDRLKPVGAIVATPICLTPDVAEGLGDLPRWTYGVAQTMPTDVEAPDAEAYRNAAVRAGLPGSDVSKVWTAIGWSLVLAYARVMNEVGADNVTVESVGAGLREFRGPVVMGAPEVTCGKYVDAGAICNDQSRFYQYEGKGSFVARTGWLRPPA
jgi:branched-chain amino acid transport system substrate-binding protein